MHTPINCPGCRSVVRVSRRTINLHSVPTGGRCQWGGMADVYLSPWDRFQLWLARSKTNFRWRLQGNSTNLV